MFGIPIEAITTIAGFIIPPAAKLIQSIFGKKETPQDALDDIAINRPEILGQYMQGLAQLADAKTKWFNRDIAGTPSQKIIDLRSVIRPGAVAFSFSALFFDALIMAIWNHHAIDEGTRAAFAGYISTWMSDRIF